MMERELELDALLVPGELLRDEHGRAKDVCTKVSITKAPLGREAIEYLYDGLISQTTKACYPYPLLSGEACPTPHLIAYYAFCVSTVCMAYLIYLKPLCII